jgi:M-phase inducer tyrosine phosphatase
LWYVWLEVQPFTIINQLYSFQSQHAPSSPDAMDIDSSFTDGLVFPPKADRGLLPAPLTAASKMPSFNIFFDVSSPGANGDDLSIYQTKKRRSPSPQPTPDPVQGRRRAGTISVFNSSSPVADSSPSVLKLERMANCAKKPMLDGLGVPSDNSMRLRKPNLSAMVPPSDAAQFTQLPGFSQDEISIQAQSTELPPPRRAFSAMLSQPGLGTRPSGDSSFEGGEESSPAQAYAKRQQIRTIRRRDGTDDFRSFKGATAMVARDKESPRARKIPEWGTGLGGFGDNEAHGKILPCHRVREDGLMRISCKTVRGLFLPRKRC